MVALDGGGVAVTPLASEVQVVRALATHMALADMVLYMRSVFDGLGFFAEPAQSYEGRLLT